MDNNISLLIETNFSLHFRNTEIWPSQVHTGHCSKICFAQWVRRLQKRNFGFCCPSEFSGL